jgi:hypothetical protein
MTMPVGQATIQAGSNLVIFSNRFATFRVLLHIESDQPVAVNVNNDQTTVGAGEKLAIAFANDAGDDVSINALAGAANIRYSVNAQWGDLERRTINAGSSIRIATGQSTSLHRIFVFLTTDQVVQLTMGNMSETVSPGEFGFFLVEVNQSTGDLEIHANVGNANVEFAIGGRL